MTATALAMNDTTPPAPGPAACRRPPHRDPTIPGVTVRSVSRCGPRPGPRRDDGDLVEVRVAGIRSTAPCWAQDALAFARTTLDGKKVWLLKETGGARDPEGRLLAKVLLPTGQNLRGGRRDHRAGGFSRRRFGRTAPGGRGRGTTCPPRRVGEFLCPDHLRRARSSGPPSASTSAPGTPGTPGTTTGSATTTAPVVVPPPPTVTTSPAPRPPDDVQRGVEMGAACSPEGARGVTAKGQDVRCMRKGEDLRWMKA